MIEARDLAVMRGEQVLFAKLSLRLAAGEVMRLSGPNGSGKTTLLRILCGLTEADAGSVLWNDKPVASQRSEFNQSLLFLGHKPGLTPEMSARENLKVLCGLQRIATDSEIEAALIAAGLEGRADQPVLTMSAGQQQRVKLARLRLSSVPLWILDEPLTSLDSDGQEWLEQQLQVHAASGGAALLTTHQELSGNNIRTLDISQFKADAADLEPDYEASAGV